MTDYSTYRRCQWLVTHRMKYLVGGGSMHGTYRQLCRKRARFAIGKWTWLCRQHATIAKQWEPFAILDRITTVAGRADGQL
jgi:hypothetical protein